jgi:aspartyl-tRNA synthetase
VTGVVEARPEGNANPNLPTGEIEVAITELAIQHLTNGVGHVRTQHQGFMLMRAAQVEVAVLQTGVLADTDVLVDLEAIFMTSRLRL